jgi:AcrR family transcriptional regulator
MPRLIDRAERETQIADAAIQLMAEQGPGAVTVRGLAEKLGGSVTLVTHFYPTRGALFRGICQRLIELYNRELAEIARSSDDRLRLRQLLIWLLPLKRESFNLERARILMAGEPDPDGTLHSFTTTMERKIRGLLRSTLKPLVPESDVESHVDALRALTNGVVLSAVEHPRLWPVRRQIATLDLVLDALIPAQGTPARTA